MNTRAAYGWGIEERQLDRGIVLGAGISFALIIVGLFVGGDGAVAINPMSLLIVFGGTFGATLVHFSWYDICHAWGCFKEILFAKSYHPQERISALVNLAHSVRQNGLLVLENESRATDDPFFRRALELTVDGQSAADVKRILETEMRSSHDRALRGVSVFQTMGTYSPALGLIGTIIGMMQMLNALNDPTTVGPAMAVALTTTLYGAILSNLLFLPISGKLKNHMEEEIVVKALTVEGVISLGKQENPMILEQRLQGYLPLSTR